MKSKIILFVFVLAFIHINNYSQSTKSIIVDEFSKSMRVDNFYVTTDNYNNVYVSGFFMDTIYIRSYLLYTRGALDIFIAKFDKRGQLLWVKQAGGHDVDLCKTIYTDVYNNVYISGAFKGQAHFEDTVLVSQRTYNYFTAKYSNNGDLLWVRTDN